MKSATLFFGPRLKDARELRGLSQRQLGALIGLSPEVGGVRINRYESGASMPRLPTVDLLAAVLVVPIAFLFAESTEEAMRILSLS